MFSLAARSSSSFLISALGAVQKGAEVAPTPVWHPSPLHPEKFPFAVNVCP